ncbi:MAG: hypothetical protein FWD17_00125 [Polyangiaceae bacterium]|nr:hypothetical protein [Polyangiaceae bacterium]
MPGAPKPRISARELDDALDPEVPAAVLCARCGHADCPGCLHEQTLSGVIALVPWERPGALLRTRLWATARASTFDADAFFMSMPDGPVAPALAFAVVSELIAASAMALFAVLAIAALAPGWARQVAAEDLVRAIKLGALGIPLIAALLVLAHAAHGFALDRGARRAGGRAALTRALRFGLYAAGWDLVIGPVGVVVIAAREGVAKAASIGGLAVGLPRRSSEAFLRGCYHLEGEAARPALRASYIAAAVATVIGAAAVIAALVEAVVF